MYRLTLIIILLQAFVYGQKIDSTFAKKLYEKDWALLFDEVHAFVSQPQEKFDNQLKELETNDQYSEKFSALKIAQNYASQLLRNIRPHKCKEIISTLHQDLSLLQRLHVEDSLLTVLQAEDFLEVKYCQYLLQQGNSELGGSFRRLKSEILIIYQNEILNDANRADFWIRAGVFPYFTSSNHRWKDRGLFFDDTEESIRNCGPDFRSKVLELYDNEKDTVQKLWYLEWLFVNENTQTPEHDKRRISYEYGRLLEEEGFKIHYGVALTRKEWRKVLRGLRSSNEDKREESIAVIKKFATYDEIPMLIPYLKSKRTYPNYSYSASLARLSSGGSVSGRMKKDERSQLVDIISNILDQRKQWRRYRYRSGNWRKLQTAFLKSFYRAYKKQSLSVREFYPVYFEEYLKRQKTILPPQFTSIKNMLGEDAPILKELHLKLDHLINIYYLPNINNLPISTFTRLKNQKAQDLVIADNIKRISRTDEKMYLDSLDHYFSTLDSTKASKVIYQLLTDPDYTHYTRGSNVAQNLFANYFQEFKSNSTSSVEQSFVISNMGASGQEKIDFIHRHQLEDNPKIIFLLIRLAAYEDYQPILNFLGGLNPSEEKLAKYMWKLNLLVEPSDFEKINEEVNNHPVDDEFFISWAKRNRPLLFTADGKLDKEKVSRNLLIDKYRDESFFIQKILTRLLEKAD